MFKMIRLYQLERYQMIIQNYRLRATDGVRIYIIDADGNEVTTLAEQEQQDGEDITLTIDSDIQTRLYEQLQNDNGLFVVMQPATGELLAFRSEL